jgi:hypothetical protein
LHQIPDRARYKGGEPMNRLVIQYLVGGESYLRQEVPLGKLEREAWDADYGNSRGVSAQGVLSKVLGGPRSV